MEKDSFGDNGQYKPSYGESEKEEASRGHIDSGIPDSKVGKNESVGKEGGHGPWATEE